MADFQYYEDLPRRFHASLAQLTMMHPHTEIPRGQRLGYYDLTRHRLKLRLWRDYHAVQTPGLEVESLVRFPANFERVLVRCPADLEYS